MPAFNDLLQQVAIYFNEKREDVRSHGEQLMDVFDRLVPQPADTDMELDAAPLDLAVEQISANFDHDFGGFGSAPKFPHPTSIERLMRYWRASANDAEPRIDALYMATLTLTRMADGGIYDHLGGGFCRYSVDQFWQIPHFEKMLYDNGPLLALYAQAYLASGEQHFAEVANETADWMLADMQAPGGGFYSTRDADSEGEEGLYYVWTPEDVARIVDEENVPALSRRFGLDQDANFEGRWHLTVRQSIDDIATELGESAEQVRARVDSGRATLLAERVTRVAPGRDEKQLTAWNALAIRGFAITGLALSRHDLIDAAADAVDFIQDHLYVDGRLLAVYKDGRARFNAYLDDYAFLLDAILELLQARWSSKHLAFAISLADTLLEHFEDADVGGFWFTADDHESLIQRLKPLADEAVPSGNGIAAVALQRLGFLLGETRYLIAAERTLRNAWLGLEEQPHRHMSLLDALEDFLTHPEVIVIRGDEKEINQWRESAAQLYSPGRMVFAIGADAGDLPGALADRKAVSGETVAYRCVGTHCELPVTSWEALAEKITTSSPDKQLNTP